ncbi:MAG: phage tail protein [Candidatus Binataceae bacterium]
MFAIFGEIVFEVLSSPETMESSRSWEYAEHRVIENSPRLQWISDPLQRLTLELMLHSSFTVPALQMEALAAAASDHRARPLILGNGELLGYFVITALSALSRQMSATGDTISISARLTLKEWAMMAELNSFPPSPPIQPIAIVAAAAGVATAPVGYAAPGGISNVLGAPGAAYIAPAISSPGVSSILSNPASGASVGPQMTAADVPARQIVRAQV